MDQLRLLAIAVVVPVFVGFAAQGDKGGQSQTKPVALWTALSVTTPVFCVSEANSLQITFGVVNDGASVVDPKIESSHLWINGVELKEWHFIASNGPRTLAFSALPPGQFLRFGYGLGRYFPHAGVYTVRWRGELFKASEATFRVLSCNR